MEKTSNDFIKEFSEKFEEFSNLFPKWWLYEKISNQEYENYNLKDLFNWYLMQSYAKDKVIYFANKLPSDAKIFIEPILNEIEGKVKTFNNENE